MQEFDFGNPLFTLLDEQAKQTLARIRTDWQPAKGQNWHYLTTTSPYSDKEAWEKWWAACYAAMDTFSPPPPLLQGGGGGGGTTTRPCLCCLPDF